MALQKDRARIFFKGLGNITVLQKEPTLGSGYVSLGSIQEANLRIIPDMVDITADTGALLDVLPQGRKGSLGVVLLQSTKDEIEFADNMGEEGYAVRYYGKAKPTKWQYYVADLAKIASGVDVPFKNDKRIIPVTFSVLEQTDLSFELPLFMLAEADAKLYIDNCVLWLSARAGYGAEDVWVPDLSGYGNHADVQATDYATIWQTLGSNPTNFFRLDGTDDYIQVPDSSKFDDDGTSDMVIEFWARFPGADGASQLVIGKVADWFSGSGAGFFSYRSAANQMWFTIRDGSTSVSVQTTATWLQNVWKHFAVAIDRNGNMQGYVNGAASGTPQSVATVNSASNALGLRIGADNGVDFGQVDVETLRVHKYSAGGLPSDIATRLLAHYNAEKSAFGL